MYEADNKSENGFEAETLRRMRDVFGGRACSVCGAAAGRLCGGEFFCYEHYPKARRAVRTPRVHRCLAPVEA